MKQEWVAVVPTTIKASAAHSSTLAEHEKMMVAAGTRVAAMIDTEDQGHWVIAGGMSGNAPLPEGIRFLFVGHWELQPVGATETKAAEEVEPIPMAAIYDEPAIPVVEPANEPDVAPPPAVFPAAKPIACSMTEPVPSKPISQRRLFALFKRGYRKNR